MRAPVRLLRSVAYKLSPQQFIADRRTRLVFQKFAERVGLVYFGYVNQRDDEHRLIRGITLSTTHTDNHYCVGSFQNYDIMTTLRSDTIVSHDANARHYDWIIMTFDFHAKVDLPRIFIGHRGFDQLFYTNLLSTHPYIAQLQLGQLGAQHDTAFLHDFAVYTRATSMMETESLLTPEMTRLIATHFKKTLIEVVDTSLYLYIESRHPSRDVLETMLASGLQLVRMFDERMTPHTNTSA